MQHKVRVLRRHRPADIPRRLRHTQHVRRARRAVHPARQPGRRREVPVEHAAIHGRVGGRALFYAWALEQDRTDGFSKHEFAAQDVLVPWHLRATGIAESQRHLKLQQQQQQQQEKHPTQPKAAESDRPLAVVDSGGGGGGGLVGALAHGTFDAAKQSVVFQRYCHVYREGELRELVEALNGVDTPPWVRVVEEYPDTGNWCLIAEKVAEMPGCHFG